MRTVQRSASLWISLQDVLTAVRCVVRQSTRAIARHRLFSISSILSLALCTAGAISSFRLLEALFLRPLPVASPYQLFEIGDQARSFWFYTRLGQDAGALFSSLAATTGGEDMQADIAGAKEDVRVSMSTGTFFETLGVTATLGRVFGHLDDARGGPELIAVISNQFWRAAFNADSSVVGRILRLNGVPLKIIGVTPPSFFGVVVGERPAVWIPASAATLVTPKKPILQNRNFNAFIVFGRVASQDFESVAGKLRSIAFAIELDRAGGNVSPEIRRELQAATPQLQRMERGISYLRKSYSQPLLWILGTSLLLVLLGSTNLGTLMLLRNGMREGELRIRLGLGASRSRLFAELLCEAAIICFLGTALGALVSEVISTVVLAVAGHARVPVLLSLSPNSTVLLEACCIFVFVMLLVGAIPAWAVIRLLSAVSTKRTVTVGRGVRVAGRVLIIVQVAFSMGVIAMCSLFTSSLYNLNHVDVGFRRENLWVVNVSSDHGRSMSDQFQRLEGLRLSISKLPGVVSTSYSASGLHEGHSFDTEIVAPGTAGSPEVRAHPRFDVVGPEYMSTLAATIITGRDFSVKDEQSSQRVVIVNDALAASLFGDRPSVGSVIYVPGYSTFPFEVVGVVRGMRTGSDLRRVPPKMFYLPQLQAEVPTDRIRLLVRTVPSPPAFAALLKERARETDIGSSIGTPNSADDMVSQTLSRDRLAAYLSSTFALLALVLSTIGVYAVVGYEQRSRTREVGVKLALGAQVSDLFLAAMTEILGLVVTGVLVGGMAVYVFGRTAEGLWFGVRSGDVGPVTLASCVLVATALAASSWPIGYIVRLDPARTLQDE